jgi:alpha-ketoglutarate-dependent taurine dioxygenase
MHFYTKYNYSQPSFIDVFTNHKLVHVASNPSQDNDTYFRGLAKECGIPLIYEENPVTGFIDVNKWTEIKYEQEKSTDSYKSSNKSQPLHTDYGYFSFEIYAAFFYCVEQADFGGATTFIDIDKVVEILRPLNSSLFKHIQAQRIHFGRKDNAIAHNDDYILQQDTLGWKINWNYYRAIGDDQNRSLIEDFKDFIDTYIEKSGELKELKLEPGEGVFFQDRRVLHGRNSFVGNRQLNKGGIALKVPEQVFKLINGN